MNRYRLFNICLASELAIPGLAASPEDGSDTWEVRVGQGGLDASGYQHVHRWDSPQGEALMSCARRGEDYALDVLGLVRCEIFFCQRLIECHPGPECSDATLAHLLLDQVLPRVLCHLGHTIVHASAVRLVSGQAVAFTGPSGRGKSTLATAFYSAGHGVFTDDCLLLEAESDGVHATPAYPSLRLWPETVEQLLDKGALRSARLTEMAHYTSKKQLLFGDTGAAGNTSRSRLAALFLLEAPETGPASESVRIRPAGGMQSMVALIEALFALDVRRKSQVQRNFQQAGDIARGVPVFRLDYPRDFACLPDVVSAIEQKMSAIC